MSFKIGLMAAAVAVAFAGPALSADAMAPAAPQATGFDWTGAYAGLFGGPWGTFSGSQSELVVGGAVGVNFMATEMVLLGGELRGQYYLDSEGTEVVALGRAGVVAADDILIYGTAGAGHYEEPGYAETFTAAGGGIEFAVTDAMTLRADVLAFSSFDAVLDFTAAVGTVGAFFHF